MALDFIFFHCIKIEGFSTLHEDLVNYDCVLSSDINMADNGGRLHYEVGLHDGSVVFVVT